MNVAALYNELARCDAAIRRARADKRPKGRRVKRLEAWWAKLHRQLQQTRKGEE